MDIVGILLFALMLGTCSFVLKYRGERLVMSLVTRKRQHEIQANVLIALNHVARSMSHCYVIAAYDNLRGHSIVEVRESMGSQNTPYVLQFVINLRSIERPVVLKHSDPERSPSPIGQTDDICVRALVSQASDYLKLRAIRARPLLPAG